MGVGARVVPRTQGTADLVALDWEEVDALDANAVRFVRACEVAERLGPRYVEWLGEALERVEVVLAEALVKRGRIDS